MATTSSRSKKPSRPRASGKHEKDKGSNQHGARHEPGAKAPAQRSGDSAHEASRSQAGRDEQEKRERTRSDEQEEREERADLGEEVRDDDERHGTRP